MSMRHVASMQPTHCYSRDEEYYADMLRRIGGNMGYDASMQLKLVVCILHELLPELDRDFGSVLHITHLLNYISHEVFCRTFAVILTLCCRFVCQNRNHGLSG
jgi:hypothetical protein